MGSVTASRHITMVKALDYSPSDQARLLRVILPTWGPGSSLGHMNIEDFRINSWLMVLGSQVLGTLGGGGLLNTEVRESSVIALGLWGCPGLKRLILVEESVEKFELHLDHRLSGAG